LDLLSLAKAGILLRIDSNSFWVFGEYWLLDEEHQDPDLLHLKIKTTYSECVFAACVTSYLAVGKL